MSGHASPTPSWRKEAEAHKRAMPLQRLLGNGMDYADVVELYRLVDEGQPWADAGAAARRGEPAAGRGGAGRRSPDQRPQLVPQRRGVLPGRAGPACPTASRKLAMYRQLCDSYGAAGQLFDPPIEHVGIPWAGGTLWGWLLRPAGVPAPATVIVMGGFDGWREEYHVGATHLLDRGMAAFLVDGPGQGETRLFGGLRHGQAASPTPSPR